MIRTELNAETGEARQVNTTAYVVGGSVVLIDEGQPVPPGAVLASSAPPPALAVPQSVTPVQAFTALDQVGKLAPLLAYLDAPDTPPLVRAVVMGATEWRRDSLLLMAVAIVLGLTPAEVDALFSAAALIEV